MVGRDCQATRRHSLSHQDRVIVEQSGQTARGRVDTTGNSAEPEESKDHLRKEGWRGNGKGWAEEHWAGHRRLEG